MGLAALGIGSNRVSPQDGMVQVYVPAGEFLMGSLQNVTQAGSDEKPQHTVYLDAYWIDKFEVTNGQYGQCVQAGACTPPQWTDSSTHSNYYDDVSYYFYPVVWWTGARRGRTANCRLRSLDQSSFSAKSFPGAAL